MTARLVILVAFAFIALAATAWAETVRLRCNHAWTVDVDMANRSAYIVYDDGRAPQTVGAEIDDRFVTWRVESLNIQTRQYTGRYILERLDRATGVLNWSQGNGWLGEGSCERMGAPVL